MKPATNTLLGESYRVLRCVNLLQHTLVDNCNARGHGHGFDLVVGHINERGLQLLMKLADLGAHLHAQFGVQIRQRFIKEEDLWLAYNRASHRDSLALTAGKLAGFAI